MTLLFFCFRGDISHDGGDNRKRRKSAPSGPVQMTPDPTQTSKLSGIPNRMKKALKRTKSVGKIERERQQPFKPTKEDIEECESPTMFGSHVKSSRSHESLNLGPQSSLDVIDLAGNDLVVRPLHSSILGQDHCFQIKTSLGSKYYSCRSSSERDKWIESILSAHYPDKDERRRTDSSLNIWVVEAKNIPQKKNWDGREYFCEICLDDSLYARTTPKHRNDMVFWGEQFTFKCLPAVEAINVHVYKEIEKKKRRDKNYIGLVSIPVNMVNSKTTVESWYRVSSPINFRGEIPALRIKARYQNISILPISQYSEFAQYLKEHSVTLCQRLEQEISVKTKEEVATSLMKILHCLGSAKEFLVEMVMKETESIKDESLVFRANTMATKSMEAYMKLIGGKYLQDTLGDFIQYLYMTNEDCEVDPTKMMTGTVVQHQESLMVMCEMACCKILNSSAAFPSDLRAIFNQLRERFAERINGDEVCSKLISGCIFLRFLCPAIMSPSLFELIQEYPNEKTSRCLTLIAKTVQALANFTKFGTKENYMKFMNEFLEREWGNMKVFLQEISSATDKSHAVKFSGYIDLGRELALTHSLLSEAVDKFDKSSKEKVSPLPGILTKISDQVSEPDKFIPYQSTHVEIDNTVTSATSVTTTTTTTSSSSSSTATSQAKKNLSKIFEDAEPSTAGDVEMLPPYEVAMDKTITKSSTINSLVDFIQQDSDSTTSISKLNSRAMNAKNGRHAKMVKQSEFEVNREDYDIGEDQSLIGSQMEPLQIVEEERTRIETKEKSHVYTVCIETVCSNTNVDTTLSTSDSSKPKKDDNGQKPRTLPLSFSNPAFQLSSRALKQKDAGTDSMSSVNSTPSNGADSDFGDVSHSSSSSGASPPRLRRTEFSKGKSFHADTSRSKHAAYVNIEPHTLPKVHVSSRPPADMVGDIYKPTESRLPVESYSSSSSIHTKMTLPIGSICTDMDSTQPQSPTEAVKALNDAHRKDFFRNLITPTDETSVLLDPNSNNQSTQCSEATFRLSSSKKHDLPQFSINMPNPKTALSQDYNNATFPSSNVRPHVVQNQEKAFSEVLLPSVSRPRQDNTAHIRITPSQIPSKEATITPVTVGAFPVLDMPQQTHNRTANNSTGLAQQQSPPTRRNIITQLGTKQKPTNEAPTCPIPIEFCPVTEPTVLQTRPSRVGSVQHRIQPVPSGASVSQDPIWTRRSEDSPSHGDIPTAEEKQEYDNKISSLKLELERMASQLAETKKQLEEEDIKAEAALTEMRLKVEATETELKVQQQEKDQQIRDVISRVEFRSSVCQVVDDEKTEGELWLMCVEEELRAEQEEMRGAVKAKQKIIDAQEIRIQSLDLANQRLMRALQALKQRCLTTSQH
ncbi:ras GTPase-activating protein nGAP-like isoform X5 [Lytechinus variegatus]|uniref:ras GTPase-activating protein nGAP-like isoform X5 n=1 Tax=Lytechinus variegatus TaxID=7654 RepID=UPI001BB1DB7D|nr:ras GTPase-activating protein nGAP-like isoform X5 [Lytechinus variegatus]